MKCDCVIDLYLEIPYNGVVRFSIRSF